MDRVQKIIELTPEMNKIQKEILSLEGKTLGDKVRNYILIKYYGMKNYEKEYGMITRWLIDTFIREKTSGCMIRGKGLSKETLLRICIGSGLTLAESLAVFGFYGYSLMGPNDNWIWEKLSYIEDEKFKELELSGNERLEALRLFKEDE